MVLHGICSSHDSWKYNLDWICSWAFGETHEHNPDIYKASQWALHNARLGDTGVFKGPLMYGLVRSTQPLR